LKRSKITKYLKFSLNLRCGSEIRHKKLISIVLLLSFIAISSYFVQDFFILLPEPEASPKEVVENFALQNKAGNFQACYYLMSSEYKSSVKLKEFKQKLVYCTPPWPYYRLLEIGEERINGDYATVEITYIELREGVIQPQEKEKKRMMLELVKEEESWKLRDLHCELRS